MLSYIFVFFPFRAKLLNVAKLANKFFIFLAMIASEALSSERKIVHDARNL